MTVADALERYDATPRQSPRLPLALAELRAANLSAGMPEWPFRDVAWARSLVAETLAQIGGKS